MAKFILIQTFIQVTILSWVLFNVPDKLDFVSSVGADQSISENAKHYTFFFNVFILLQIFN